VGALLLLLLSSLLPGAANSTCICCSPRGWAEGLCGAFSWSDAESAVAAVAALPAAPGAAASREAVGRSSRRDEARREKLGRRDARCERGVGARSQNVSGTKKKSRMPQTPTTMARILGVAS
jgi:hypothetical protein